MLQKTEKKGPIKAILSVLVLILAIGGFFGYALPAYTGAQRLGIGVGDRAGKAVGKLKGSIDGVSYGIKEGAKDGKEEGLSAKDTKAEIGSSFEQTGNLEVLEAGISLENLNSIGKDYKVLMVMKGVAVYSVDLRAAEIREIDTDAVEVVLPEIVVEIYIDERATEKLAEAQKHSWTGNAEDGYKEIMNSREKIDEEVREKMGNYDALIDAAKSSAIKQVRSLAEAATGRRKKVTVTFKEEQSDE